MFFKKNKILVCARKSSKICTKENGSPVGGIDQSMYLGSVVAADVIVSVKESKRMQSYQHNRTIYTTMESLAT